MIMITFEWHLLIYIAINLILFIWAITRDDYDGFLGSDRTWAMLFFFIVLIISTSVYGGIFWW